MTGAMDINAFAWGVLAVALTLALVVFLTDRRRL
jgi:hypothetical protein